ncbi:MAG: SDR family NAD(P)-dependent oxidoreductase [Gammaproteobacteria bacterium]|jgi:benzil reductase ((S)-benzoin forming)
MSDRVAVVTGTSSGIGAALARRLLNEGWAVAGLSRREVALEHGGYQHMVLDLGNLHALQTLAEKRLGALMRDPRWARVALVNNAALGGSHKGIEDTDPEELAWLLAVNTVAPVYLMGFAARTVPPQTALRIVNVSSGAAHRGFPGLGDYCASKAALRLAGMALGEELRSEGRPGGARADAAVLSYEPGVVDTPMQTRARSGGGEDSPWSRPFRDFREQGLLEKPEDVIGPVVEFLSGDAGSAFVEKRFGA